MNWQSIHQILFTQFPLKEKNKFKEHVGFYLIQELSDLCL
jgi:hypothetical protein